MTLKFLRALKMGTAAVATALAVSALPGAGHAAWPEKAIQWVVVFAPGGGSDVIARAITPFFSKELGVPVNVINKPGGNQIPAINYVMDSPPDGYILLQEQQAASAIKAILDPVPIDIGARTFGPLIAGGANAIVVNGDLPWNSLKDMAGFIKANPGEFTYYRGGGSSFTDMVNKRFFQLAGIDTSTIKAVDFEGAGPAKIAVAGGHIMMSGGGAGSMISLVSSGDVKALAVTGTQRVSALPDVPSTAEAGFPDLDLVNWYGVSGPPGLPDEVVNRLNEVALKLSKDPEFIAEMGKIAHYPFYKSPQDTRGFVLKEAEFYKALAGK